jgi:hypothetical protein
MILYWGRPCSTQNYVLRTHRVMRPFGFSWRKWFVGFLKFGRMKKLLTAVLVALALTAPAAAAPKQPIRIALSQHVGYAPMALKITIHLGVVVKERPVCLLLDTTWGDGKTETTCQPWDTEKQGSQIIIHIRNMPAAEYVVQAAVHLGGDKWERSTPAYLSVR